MTRRLTDAGFSAVELLIVVALMGSLAAITVPISGTMIDDIQIRGDAHAVSGTLALTKMTAAAKFTRARLLVNLGAGTYRIETWRRTGTPGWVAEGSDLRLSAQNGFGFGALATAPPNTQVALAQPVPCLDAAEVAIAGTACVIYNSRGTPISAGGAPVTTQAVYLGGPTGVFGVVIGATGQQQVWRSNVMAGGVWVQQ